MSVAITVHFPDPIYQRLQQQASVLERPVDDIIRQTVEQGLPLWLDIIPPNFEKQLAQLDKVSLSQLKKIANSKLPVAKQRKLDGLLQKNSEGVLTSKEIMELDNVQLEANLLMLKKARAFALLRIRGFDVKFSDNEGIKQ